jgi:hypothetical protein
LQERGRVVFSAAIDGAVYAKHGTTIDTRLTVIDKLPADDPAVSRLRPASRRTSPRCSAGSSAALPPRLPVDPSVTVPSRGPRPAACAAISRAPPSAPAVAADEPEGVELAYETVDWTPPEGGRLTDAIYEEYGLQAIRIPGAQAHPTKLVQSAAMASVAPPKPSYRPHAARQHPDGFCPTPSSRRDLCRRGPFRLLAGSWTVDETFDVVSAARDDAPNAVRFRRGFMLGDGTGAARAASRRHHPRQLAAGPPQGGLDLQIRQADRGRAARLVGARHGAPAGHAAVALPAGQADHAAEGVLFTTYATLRSDDRGEKVSRVKQIVEWLGSDFDGVIIFDESHAMQNAAGGKGERGDVAASQQGRAGLRLQHALPNARVVYVSATGATTVHNLAYAQRLGLWGGEDFPFATRAEFVEAIEAGGVAAMEVLARDLRALGLYTARSLSYDGVEYELVEHQLTPSRPHLRRLCRGLRHHP